MCPKNFERAASISGFVLPAADIWASTLHAARAARKPRRAFFELMRKHGIKVRRSPTGYSNRYAQPVH